LIPNLNTSLLDSLIDLNGWEVENEDNMERARKGRKRSWKVWANKR